jgi:hypothetical protein
MIIFRKKEPAIVFHRSKVENYGQLFISRQLRFGSNVGSAIGNGVYCFIKEEDANFNKITYGRFITYFKADLSKVLDTLNLKESIERLSVGLNINMGDNKKYTDYVAWECYEQLRRTGELSKISGIRYTRQSDGDCVVFYSPYKDLRLMNKTQIPT